MKLSLAKKGYHLRKLMSQNNILCLKGIDMNTFNHKVTLSELNETVGTGWLPPLPDLRDYTTDKKEIKELTRKLRIGSSGLKQSAVVDLRQWCTPVENQGSLGSCTAHAGIGVVEYFENRSFGTYSEGSRLFLYKTTRNLMQTKGDTGAWLRNTMGALVLCGVPPEKYFPYNIEEFDNEPGSFVYAVADNYESLKYFCHDPQGANTEPPNVLLSIKNYLLAGIPSMFGFWGFGSFENTDVKGGIPYPCQGESAEWGHAIVAVGYNDNKKITNTRCNKTTTGALLIRNSWGTAWGENGYGWLPYDYILNKLANDFWSLLGMEWIETKQFGI
jgi:C1A family cysteine protease